MSLENFKPEIWSARMNYWYPKNLVYASLCNRNWEGDISQKGDKVRITDIGEVDVNSYTGTITYQELQDQATTFPIDQQSYWAFISHDADKAQTMPGVVDRAMMKASYKMNDKIDQYVAGKYTQAGTISATPEAINSVNAFAALMSMKEVLDGKNVPSQGRWAVLPSWYITKLVLGKYMTQADPLSSFVNGDVGQTVAGFRIHMSNNVPTTNGGTEYKIIGGVNDAWTFASQLAKTEALKDITKFGDFLRGYALYDAMVNMPDALVVLDATILAEPV